MIHHRLRSLIAVETSAVPSCSCANPSLTVAARSDEPRRLLLSDKADHLDQFERSPPSRVVTMTDVG